MNVAVLCGGSSSERRVSLASAQHLARTLTQARLWFLTPLGEIHVLDAAQLAAVKRPFEEDLVPEGPAAFADLEQALRAVASAQLVVFLALHGGDGEDGTLQRRLELLRIPFTGSGSRASALAFDKALAKAQLGAQGARLAPSRLLPPMTRAAAVTALEALLDEAPRWMLKPVADGSSVGLLPLNKDQPLEPVADALSARHVRYLAEPFVSGRELTVGVIEEPRGTRALPVSEVILDPDATFDYAGKYLGHGNREITPAKLTDAETEAAQVLALLAHQTLGCAGYSRTDMILTPEGPVFLETNTLPGLTTSSFIPQQLRAAGKPFAEFLSEQLALARSRSR